MKVSAPDVSALMAFGPDELKASLEGLPQPAVKALCDALWENIRGQNLHGGQPRNQSSRSSLEFARLGLTIAEQVNTSELLAEAESMMAYALNANECFEQSLEYY